jgi:steroid 5-alpha reductase family enzyme
VLFAINLAAIAAAMIVVWLLSLARRDVSIVDVFWGLGFVLVALVSHACGEGAVARKNLITILTIAWGLRLAIYLLWRNWDQEEDYRYRAMRARYGERFPLVSLYLVFGLQGALMWIVSLPIQVAQSSPTPEHLTWLDVTGALLWAVGLGFEAIGDWQLSRFRADAANRGKVMDRGLWRYTRHPNYFGDFLVWWGFGAIALAGPLGAFALVGPALMSVLLLRVSGVAMLERTIGRRRPGYREYQLRTNAFFPGPPRRGSG